MRQIVDTYNVYKFEELNEDAKDKALEKYYHINVEHDWYDNTYEDIKTLLGITITGFDLDRGQYVEFDFSCNDITKNFLKGLHGMCFSSDRHFGYLVELTEKYLADFDRLDQDEAKDMSIDEIQDELYEERCEIKAQLEDAILQNLRSEYEYLTSEEAVIEAFEANECEFKEDGTIY